MHGMRVENEVNRFFSFEGKRKSTPAFPSSSLCSKKDKTDNISELLIGSSQRADFDGLLNDSFNIVSRYSVS